MTRIWKQSFMNRNWELANVYIVHSRFLSPFSSHRSAVIYEKKTELQYWQKLLINVKHHICLHKLVEISFVYFLLFRFYIQILYLSHNIELSQTGYLYITVESYPVFVLLQFVPMEENDENYASDLPIAETSQVSSHPLVLFFRLRRSSNPRYIQILSRDVGI